MGMPKCCNATICETYACPVRTIDLNNFQVANNKTARDINCRIVLNLIRKHQPISRADLSRHSRLQRSTVSSITEQLIAERWVTMGGFGDLPRGRKPVYIHLNGEDAGIVGVDIRPTETTIALGDLDMRFLMRESMSTSSDANQFVSELGQRICRMMNSRPQISFEGIGVAMPGRVDPASSGLVFAPNLGWKASDIKGPLERATKLPVQLENAANACALAEIMSDSGSESVRNLAAITVSEGIGVGMILNGQLVRGTNGLAGEFGHVTIQEDGPLCKCGNKGCLEVCGSNTAAVRYFSELVLNRDKKKPARQPSFESILVLAEQGDANACEALARIAYSLGAGVAMLVTGLAPDLIVVVGELTRAWHLVGPIINQVVAERSATGMKTRIVPSDSGAQPRLRGAFSLVLHEHFGAPHII
jgi:predicted NBD/HSP70 family sugar kinase